jgi:hypothetical protein
VEIARLAAAEAERQRAAKLAEGRAAEERSQEQAAVEARTKEERAFTEARGAEMSRLQQRTCQSPQSRSDGCAGNYAKSLWSVLWKYA